MKKKKVISMWQSVIEMLQFGFGMSLIIATIISTVILVVKFWEYIGFVKL